MRKAAGAVRLVIKYILFIGFTVQIILGFFWMAGNFAKVQDFTPVDMGVYPFFLRLAGRGYGLIYLLQLGAALYAGYRLLNSLHVGDMRICLWGSLAMMTLPMAMQCHLALLPYSLVGSLELLEISCVCQSAGEKDMLGEKALWGSIACFTAQCLLWPKYCIPGAVLPLLLLLRRLPGMLRKRECRFRGLLAAVCFLAVAAAGYGAERSGEDGRSNTSGLDWLLVKRFCWPTIWGDWGGEPETFNLATSKTIWVIGYYPNNMDVYLKPELDAMTPETAESVMRKMVSRAWSKHYPMVVRQIGWDVLGYSVTPVILPLQLEGDAYDSYSGRNYEMMRNGTPILAKYYVKVSCGWFTVSLVLLAGAVVLDCIGRFSQTRKSAKAWRERLAGVFPFFAVVISAGVLVLFFTMQGAGIMDYKYTVWVNQLWIAGSIMIVGFEQKKINPF
ncbi:MAG: hypothetical protein K2J60_08365 [Acetatifactor sp.]|nr:hypothetical protein [Acetatifactor sp.]